MFFIHFTQQDKTGKWFLHKQKYLRFFRGLCKLLPCRDLWINRLYFNISNSSKKQCLTIDTRDVNELGLAKFRKEADNNSQPNCYYKRNKRDKTFNSFLAIRK